MPDMAQSSPSLPASEQADARLTGRLHWPARAWVLSATTIIIAVQVYMALVKGLHWDEFHHFDIVRRLANGTLTHTLQTFYGHYFSWLLTLPGDVIDRVRTARLSMLLFEVGAAVALFGLARRFASDTAATLVALAYLSAGFVVVHGTAFRTDPQAAFLLTTALWLLATRRLTLASILAFGVLTGLAAMITIKVVFYAPAFAGIAWLRLSEGKKAIAAKLAASVGASLITFAALYAWHAGFVAKPAVSAGLGTVSSAGRVVFGDGFFPAWPTFLVQLFIAPHVTLLAIATFFYLPRLAMPRAQRWCIGGMLLPLASVLVYTNAYPYFFVFLLPPVLAAMAPALDHVLIKQQRFSLRPLLVFMPIWAVFLATTIPSGVLETQKQTIEVAHRLFPEPVTYFDIAGMMGDHDRALTYMPAGWGLKNYTRRGNLQLSEIMAQKTVPLLIDNHAVFTVALRDMDWHEHFFEADAEALRDSYINHWGKIWVAGKQIPAGEDGLTIDVRIPGPYTLEGSSLQISGVAYQPGDVIELRRGLYEIGGNRADNATLRWGDHLEIPAAPPPSAPIF